MLRLFGRGGGATVEAERPSGRERPWFMGTSPSAQVARRTTDPFLRRHVAEVVSDGLTVIRGAIPPSLCDAVRDEYVAYCESSADASAFVDQHGHHSRLSNFHLISESARRIGTDERLMRFSDVLLGHRTQVWSCLIFEKGTEQAIHRDAPFFCTVPRNYFLGIWTALEDLDDRAGPLQYLRGGHRAPIDPLEIAAEVRRTRTANQGEFLEACYHLYQDRVEAWCAENGCEATRVRVSKGDTVVWHPLLPHGGSPVQDATLSRASIVFHVHPEGTPLCGLDVFFGLREGGDSPAPMVAEYNGRRFVTNGAASFFADV